MALEDTVILAKALRDQPDTEHAFATYEEHRRDRAHGVWMAVAASPHARSTVETPNLNNGRA